jgi:hypothetical protein
MRKLVLLSFVVALAPAALADYIENFDSYLNQAAFEVAWPRVNPLYTMDLSQTFGYSDSQSVHGITPVSTSPKRNYHNLGAEYAGTDAQPLVFEFQMFLDPNASTNTGNARNYCEIRGYTGAGYNDGSLQSLIAIGVYNTTVPADSTHYSARVSDSTANWFPTTALRVMQQWVNLKAEIMTSTVNIYVDGVLSGSATRTAGASYDDVVVGSGVTSAGMDAFVDDMKVYNTPEPAGLALLALGLLLRRR